MVETFKAGTEGEVTGRVPEEDGGTPALLSSLPLPARGVSSFVPPQAPTVTCCLTTEPRPNSSGQRTMNGTSETMNQSKPSLFIH